jgi:hypothetical protein
MTALNDNYGEFIERLETAMERLMERRASQDKTTEILHVLLQHHCAGLRSWEARRRQVETSIASYSEGSKGRLPLDELHDTALKMESGFRARTERIHERLSSLRGRRSELINLLSDLDRSKMKLTSSRILSQERRNLDEVIANLAGTPEVTNAFAPDPGLRDDLKEARQAVILAEALIEVKEA